MSGPAAVAPERSLFWRRISADVNTADESFAPKKGRAALVLLLCCFLVLSKFGICGSSGTGRMQQAAVDTL